jgi:hypothetical protein
MKLPRRWTATLARHVRAVSALLGAVAAAAYTLQSAPHMVVPGAHDKLTVGVLLTLLGAAIGWTAGCILPIGRDAMPPAARGAQAGRGPHERI